MSHASEIQHVTAAVWTWQAYDPSVKAELTSTAVRTGEGLVLIDPIPLAPDALAELTAQAAPAAIVLTNGNHARAANVYRKRYGVPVLAHRDAAPEAELPLDREIGEGERLFNALEVIELPGAGPGEIALCAEGASLHLGDAVINSEHYGFTLLPEKYCTNAKLLPDSLQKLLRFEFNLLTFAHGLPLTTKARQRLIQLLA